MFCFGQALGAFNSVVAEYDWKHKLGLEAAHRTNIYRVRAEKKRQPWWLRGARSWRRRTEMKGQLARVERKLEAVRVKKDLAVVEARSERDEVIAKYKDWFGKVCKYVKDLEEAQPIDLKLCQASGTLECLKVAEDDYGVVIPTDLRERLYEDQVAYKAEYEKLPFSALHDVDFARSLMDLPARFKVAEKS